MTNFIKKYYRSMLFILFILIWIWSAYNPASGKNWLAENNIIFFFIPVIFICCFWYIQFSKLSFTLISLFLILHIIGAHYNYGFVPFGNFLGKITGLDGNLYDKFVHFSFGLLILYPIREFLLRVSGTKGFWSYLFPFISIMGFSAIYEIIEWFTIFFLPKNTAYLFIGGNDPFDTTKDMFSAGVGAIISLIIVAALERKHLKVFFWKKITESFKRDKRNFPKEDTILHKDIL